MAAAFEREVDVLYQLPLGRFTPARAREAPLRQRTHLRALGPLSGVLVDG